MKKKKYFIKLYKNLSVEEKDIVDNFINTLTKKEDFEDSKTIIDLVNTVEHDVLFKTYVVLGIENPNIGMECMAIATTIPGIDFTKQKFFCNKKDCKNPICGKNQVWISGYVINKKYKDQGKGYRRDLTNKIIEDVLEYNRKNFDNNNFNKVIKSIFTYLPNNHKVQRAIQCLKKKHFVLYSFDNKYLFFKKQLDIFDCFNKDINKSLDLIANK